MRGGGNLHPVLFIQMVERVFLKSEVGRLTYLISHIASNGDVIKPALFQELQLTK